jgi:uncharacterized protein (DUF1330 family)
VTVYVVAQLAIHDRAHYGQYEAGFMEVFGKFAGRLLAVDEQPEVLEGEWGRTRVVIGTFPDAASFRAWWDSTEYREIARHRHAGSEATILLVKGLDAA